jgi:hypothetical protein
MTTKLHQIQMSVKNRQNRVDDLFGKLIDACWPEDDEPLPFEPTDSKKSRRVSKAQVRRASLLGLPLPPSPSKNDTNTQAVRDKTMSFLRVLSTALDPGRKD